MKSVFIGRTAPDVFQRNHGPLRLMKFAFVGSTGVIINTAMFWLLTSWLHVYYLLAAPCAIEVALCSNYFLNHHWTFADRSSGRANLIQFAQYHAVSIGGMLITLAVLQMLVGFLGVLPMLANLCGIGFGMAWNFALNARWTWRRLPSRSANLSAG